MLHVRPVMTDHAELKATMSREAKLKGPAHSAVCPPMPPAHDAEPRRNTRETFAALGVELGLREVSRLG